MGPTVVLRPLRADDEAAFRRGHQQMAAEGFELGLGFATTRSFREYLAFVARWEVGQDLPPHWVPGTFLAADVDGDLVGRVSIRHQLNDFLAHEGGHIGYGVLPAHRRRGYATQILARALERAAALGIDPALVTCDDENVASARVIERNGGVLEDRVTGDDGQQVRRYWVPTG